MLYATKSSIKSIAWTLYGKRRRPTLIPWGCVSVQSLQQDKVYEVPLKSADRSLCALYFNCSSDKAEIKTSQSNETNTTTKLNRQNRSARNRNQNTKLQVPPVAIWTKSILLLFFNGTCCVVGVLSCLSCSIHDWGFVQGGVPVGPQQEWMGSGRIWHAAGWAQGSYRGALALLFGHGLTLRRADCSKEAPTWGHPELVQQAVQIDVDGGNFQTEVICYRIMQMRAMATKVKRQDKFTVQRETMEMAMMRMLKTTRREKAKSKFSSQNTVRGKVSEGCWMCVAAGEVHIRLFPGILLRDSVTLSHWGGRWNICNLKWNLSCLSVKSLLCSYKK